MDIDELRNNWNSIKIPPAYRQDELSDLMAKVRRGRVSTLRDRYAAISRSMSLVCVVGILLFNPFFHEAPVLTVLAICFFILMGCLHFLTYRMVSRMHFSEMTVCEAIETVCRLDTRRVRLRALGLTLGLPLIVYMFFTLSDLFGNACLYGCMVGAVVGGAIGLIINHRCVVILREMREEISRED